MPLIHCGVLDAFVPFTLLLFVRLSRSPCLETHRWPARSNFGEESLSWELCLITLSQSGALATSSSNGAQSNRWLAALALQNPTPRPPCIAPQFSRCRLPDGLAPALLISELSCARPLLPWPLCLSAPQPGRDFLPSEGAPNFRIRWGVYFPPTAFAFCRKLPSIPSNIISRELCPGLTDCLLFATPQLLVDTLSNPPFQSTTVQPAV